MINIIVIYLTLGVIKTLALVLNTKNKRINNK